MITFKKVEAELSSSVREEFGTWTALLFVSVNTPPFSACLSYECFDGRLAKSQAIKWCRKFGVEPKINPEIEG